MAWTYEPLVGANKWTVDYFTHANLPDLGLLTLSRAHTAGERILDVNESLYEKYTGGIWKIPTPIFGQTLRLSIGEIYEYNNIDRLAKKIFITTGLANNKAINTTVTLKNRCLFNSNIKALIYNDEYRMLNSKIEAKMYASGLSGFWAGTLILRFQKIDNNISFYACSTGNHSANTAANAVFYKVINNVITLGAYFGTATGLTAMTFRKYSFEILENTMACYYENPEGTMNLLGTISDSSLTTSGFCGIETGYRAVSYSSLSKIDQIKISEVIA